MTAVEILTLVPLATLVVIFGLQPGLLLNLFSSTVTETLASVPSAPPIVIPAEVAYGVLALIAVLVLARVGWALIAPTGRRSSRKAGPLIDLG